MNQSSEQNANPGSAASEEDIAIPASDSTQVPPHIPVNPQNSHQYIAQKQQSMQPQTMLGVEEVRAQWKQKISAAKGKWGKLTEYELLKSEGHQQKLSDLVRARYVVSRHDAENQVRRFFNEHEF